MELKKLLVYLFFFGNLGVSSYSQNNTINEVDAIAQRIQKVENSLRPLVLNEGQSLWNIEEQIQKYNIPGLSIAVINNYKIDWAKGYGNTGNKEIPKVTDQTLFQAASMSKFVNAVAIMKLVDLQKISLDEDINTYLTSWKFSYNKKKGNNPITIRQLLSHTAGLSTHGFNGYKNADNLPSITQILEGENPANSDKVKQILPNNKKFQYSGGGTTISQLILMDKMDSSYEDFLSDYLFEPIGMNNSFYSIEFDKYQRDMAYGYTNKGKVLKNHYNYYPESAAAGLWTTPSDLAKLIIEVQLSLSSETDKVLPQKSALELIQPTIRNSNSALGVFTEKLKEEVYLQHSGSNKGFRGSFYFSAQNGNGVVIMMNGTGTKIIEEIIMSVASVYDWVGVESYEVKNEIKLSESDLKKYLGTYVLDKREVQVTLKKGALVLTEKGKWSSKLTPLSKSKFVIDVVKPRATIEFISNDAGTVHKSLLKQGESTEWIKK